MFNQQTNQSLERTIFFFQVNFLATTRFRFSSDSRWPLNRKTNQDNPCPLVLFFFLIARWRRTYRRKSRTLWTDRCRGKGKSEEDKRKNRSQMWASIPNYPPISEILRFERSLDQIILVLRGTRLKRIS